MALLPSSGPLSLGMIMAEFGGAAPPTNLRAYLKGAGYVTAQDVAPGVPSSGELRMNWFRGAGKYVSPITATSSTISMSGWAGPDDPWTVYADGSVTAYPSGGDAPYSYEWVAVSGAFEFESPYSATTRVFLVDPPPGLTVWGQINCLITDSRGSTGGLGTYVNVSVGHD